MVWQWKYEAECIFFGWLDRIAFINVLENKFAWNHMLFIIFHAQFFSPYQMVCCICIATQTLFFPSVRLKSNIEIEMHFTGNRLYLKAKQSKGKCKSISNWWKAMGCSRFAYALAHVSRWTHWNSIYCKNGNRTHFCLRCSA